MWESGEHIDIWQNKHVKIYRNGIHIICNLCRNPAIAQCDKGVGNVGKDSSENGNDGISSALPALMK